MAVALSDVVFHMEVLPFLFLALLMILTFRQLASQPAC